VREQRESLKNPPFSVDGLLNEFLARELAETVALLKTMQHPIWVGHKRVTTGESGTNYQPSFPGHGPEADKGPRNANATP
jgi:hypothetical protein